jgi:hypothetical protein
MTQTKQELTKSSGTFEVSPETLVPDIQRLANFYKVELSDDQWRFSLAGPARCVPRDQLTSGFNRIPVTHTFMPMPAEPGGMYGSPVPVARDRGGRWRCH